MEQPRNYAQTRPALIQAVLKKLTDKELLRHPEIYAPRACNIFFETFDADFPGLGRSLVDRNDFQEKVKNLTVELASSDQHGYLSDDGVAYNSLYQNQLRQDPRYRAFIQPYLPSTYFNWKTKLLLFAAPPVGVGVAAAIKSTDGAKAVHDFFAANASVIAGISTAYYAVLLLACAVQYCRNQRGGQETVPQQDVDTYSP